MRRFVSIVLILSAAGAFAFDSAEWLEKRRLLTHEVERLRAAYAECVKRLDQPADDVTVPVETFEDGSVKTIVFAKRAQYFMDRGLVWAEGVSVKKFKPDGSLDGQIDAERVVVDRFTKSGWAEGAATVTHGDTTFRGKGVYFSSPEGYVKVCSGSRIDSKDLKFGGARP